MAFNSYNYMVYMSVESLINADMEKPVGQVMLVISYDDSWNYLSFTQLSLKRLCCVLDASWYTLNRPLSSNFMIEEVDTMLAIRICNQINNLLTKSSLN